MNALPDVQGSVDERALVIDRVGIRGMRHPIRWRTADEALASVGLWDKGRGLGIWHWGWSNTDQTVVIHG